MITPLFQAAVDEMRNLLAALAVDPHAAVSSSAGTAFFADRAAVLAEAVAGELAASWEGTRATVEFMSIATEGLGLMLRVLQVFGVDRSLLGARSMDGEGNALALKSIIFPIKVMMTVVDDNLASCRKIKKNLQFTT